MLNWIKSRRKSAQPSGHPLGSAAAIETFVQGLPRGEPQQVLVEVGDWLADADHLAEQLGPAPFVRAVLALDSAARGAVEACWGRVLAGLREKGSAPQLVGVLQAYLNGVFACNRKALDLLETLPDGQDKRGILLVRSVIVWVELKRLRIVQYRPVEEHWWAEMHALVARAERHGLLMALLPAYLSERSRTSVWQEYFSTLLFEAGPLGGLNPDEINVVDRLARWIEPCAHYVEHPSASTPYYIVPHGRNGPERCRDNLSHDPRTRFFGAGKGRVQLMQLRLKLVSDATLPPWLQESGCTPERIGQLLDLLIRHWGEPPERRLPRHKASGSLRVVHGFELICRMVAASETARSGCGIDYEGFVRETRARRLTADMPADLPPPPTSPLEVLRALEAGAAGSSMETWEQVDASSEGMGVQFRQKRAWMRIGTLIGYRAEDELDWRVGVIRRLGQQGELFGAGVAIFDGLPCSAGICRAAPPSGDGAGARPDAASPFKVDAIRLSLDDNQLLVPSGTFAGGEAVQVLLDGRLNPARVGEVEQREDFDLLRVLPDEARQPAGPAVA